MNNQSTTISLLVTLISFCLGAPATILADGDLAVSVSNGNLKIQGQNNTNHALFVAAASVPNTLDIFAFDGTTFNGQPALSVPGVTGSVNINLKSGEAVVILTEANQASLVISGDLKITTTGNEPAIVILDTVVVGGRSTIRTKNGADAVFSFRNTFLGRIQIKLGNGNDAYAGIGNEYSSDLSIQAGNGDDFTILFAEDAFGKADVKMGNQNDTLGVFTSMINDLRLNGNGGFDIVGADAFNVFGIQPTPKSFEDVFVGDEDDMHMLAEMLNPTYAEAVDLFEFFGLSL